MAQYSNIRTALLLTLTVLMVLFCCDMMKCIQMVALQCLKTWKLSGNRKVVVGMLMKNWNCLQIWSVDNCGSYFSQS